MKAKPVQLQFQLKPLKVTTISDKSDLKIRFDLFERLNTGGVSLTAQEIHVSLQESRSLPKLPLVAKRE